MTVAVTAAPTTVRVFGIRHHGPGSARAVRRALQEYRPDIVVVEGPPEADALVALAAEEDLVPPVALLAYTEGIDPQRAAFWPFAVFSPEWQALRYAVDNGVPLRFFDLPAAHRLAMGQAPADEDAPVVEEIESDPVVADPIGALAAAAGYDDPERWWDDVIEHRMDGAPPFEALAEAMAEVRGGVTGTDDARREAYMRTVLREVGKTHGKVAVVCGAWHVPALTGQFPPASHDRELLRGLPKAKVAVTWVPWTHGRLASWQGYGAGVASPGWYHHLFTTTDRVIERWLVGVAAMLRGEDVPVSSAHVIEAVRLAETLATLRGRPLAGLAEVTEATRAVLVDGDDIRLALVHERLVVGERLGSVPDDTPAVPLARDLAALQKRLRLKPEALERDLDLDLRGATDLDRSRLLHRLRLLDVGWGEPAGEARRGKGTFWESWRLCWRPEYAIDLVTASAYGTTVQAAATAKAREQAAHAPDLAAVTAMVEACLLADLPDAFADVLRALDDRVALDADVAHLMAALPALARALRYGDVRGTDTGALATVVAGMVVRICVGLPAAVTALADDAATQMRQHVDALHAALGLLDGEEALAERWLATLAGLAGRDDLHGQLAGRFTRILYDASRLDAAEAGRRMGLVLTIGVPPARAAAWIEGFFTGGGLLLVHDERMLALVDAWLAGIPADTFVEVLPLLRRTFGGFAPPERRAIGERVRRGDRSARPSLAGDDQLDHERAAQVLPTVSMLLGLPGEDGEIT